MELRDYFAAKAMQAILTRFPQDQVFDEERIAGAAYHVANAMMEAREENQREQVSDLAEKLSQRD